ncbi:fumarylacetoacetate hydrolase family protein [Streptomyces sp. NPDC044780]|uniref:2-keto-4-pentenoate hydratase n=1 Tax=unclassified Streptomyces TaxID=2593676 RepID=UPI0033E9D36E
MPQWTPETVAHDLYAAERDRRDREPFTNEWPDFSLAEAYTAQDRLLELKREHGERIIGVKLGLTSRAKQRRMGISSPLTAWLTDAMVLPQDVPVPVGELIHPRIEPEIAFVMGERLAGPGVTGATALAAVRSVHAGFEVIDSRYRDFRFQLPDVVADNASSSRFVVSPTGRPPADLELAREGCVFRIDGEVVDTATGAAVQGHPAEALALAANSLAERGLAIEPGWIVLTGGMTDAAPVRRGTHATAEFTHLGTVGVVGG